MKKLTRIFIVVFAALLCGMVTTYINKPKSIDNNTEAVMIHEDTTSIDNSKDGAIADGNLTFSVLGDVHGNIDSFEDAIKDLNTINPHMDALVLNGDTVDQGKEESYASIKKTLSSNKNLLPKTIIKNIGNHEFYNYEAGTNSPEQVQTFINRYLEFSGE